MKRYQVYAIGNALLDTEYEVPDGFLQQRKLPKGQTTRLCNDFLNRLSRDLHTKYTPKVYSCGGSTANSLIVLRYFGGNAFYTCAVGKDNAGDYFLESLSSAGVNFNDAVRHPEGCTGQCIVMVTPDSERTMSVGLGVAGDIDFCALDTFALANSEYFFIEGYLASGDDTVEAAIKARTTVKDAGGKIALTFSDPFMVLEYKNQLSSIIGDGVDLLFCNEIEASEWTDYRSLKEGIRELRKLTTTLVVTLGAKGAIILEGDKEIHIPAHPTQAIDTNGAGDNFSGAFLYGITHGMGLEEAGLLASRTAASVVSQFGPRLPNDQYHAIRQTQSFPC